MLYEVITSYILLPVLLIGIFLVAHSKEVQALEIQAELLPQQLQVGGYGQLKITVTGARKAEIQLPDVDGLTMQPRGSMQSMQIINGDTTISYTANYLVVPQHQGQFTIEPITATVKGETVTAAPLQFEVADTGSSAGGSVITSYSIHYTKLYEKTTSTRNSLSACTAG